MIPTDVYRSKLNLTIASLRYWIPSVSDTAAAELTEIGDAWRLEAVPNTTGACPFELILRSDQHFDLRLDGTDFEDQDVVDLDFFLPLAEALSAGNVVISTWRSVATGHEVGRAARVRFADGRVWTCDWGHSNTSERGDDEVVQTDRHFLPYRR